MEREAVSPELVLVDPELACRERARLREKAALEAYLATHLPVTPLAQPAVAVERAREPGREHGTATRQLLRKRLLPAALVVSLFANGYLASDLVLRADRQSETAVPVAVRPVTATHELQVTSATTAVKRSASATRGEKSTRLARKSVVERMLVSLILSAPSRKLPRAFVDPKTGLVRNNVQVVCRAAKRRSYLCTVRLANARAGKALVVRYRAARTGRGAFTWYGYKSSK